MAEEELLSPRGSGLTYGPGEGEKHRRESFFGFARRGTIGSSNSSSGPGRRATVAQGGGGGGGSGSGSLSQPLIPVDPEFYVEMNLLAVQLQGVVGAAGERALSAGDVLGRALEWLRQLRPHFTDAQSRAVAHTVLQNAVLRMPPEIPRRRIDAYLALYAVYARAHAPLAELRAATPDSAFETPAAAALVFREIAALLPAPDAPDATPAIPAKEQLPFLAFLLRHRYTPHDALAEQTRLQRKVQAHLATQPPLSPHLLLHRQGYLFKRGHVVKNWKRRWFVVNAEAVLYYETQTASDPKGSFPAADILEIVLPRDDEFGKPFCIQLVLSNKTFYVLQCQSYAELKSWIDTLYQILANIQSSGATN